MSVRPSVCLSESMKACVNVYADMCMCVCIIRLSVCMYVFRASQHSLRQIRPHNAVVDTLSNDGRNLVSLLT